MLSGVTGTGDYKRKKRVSKNKSEVKSFSVSEVEAPTCVILLFDHIYPIYLVPCQHLPPWEINVVIFCAERQPSKEVMSGPWSRQGLGSAITRCVTSGKLLN